jgi:hypothetical protein
MPPGPPPGRFGGSFGSPDTTATVNADVATAFEQAVRAIEAAGGQVQWQAPPQSAQFYVRKKDMWNTGGTTVGYRGELSVTPVAPEQSRVGVRASVDWPSTVPLLIATVVAVFIFVLFSPAFLPFLLLFWLLAVAYTLWLVASKLPSDVSAGILKRLPGGSAAPGRTGLGAWLPSGQGRMPSPPPPSPVAPAAPPAPAQNLVEQIKQLAGLREAGILTVEEFEAKKAELLKRL